jgi:HPt (histidine-containing phosphotransfer) domain-containing protein
VPALDPATIDQLAASLPAEELARILRSFEDDLARLAADYEAAAGAGERDSARRAAHALAGAAAAIGARRLEAAARRAMLAPDAAADPALTAAIRGETAAALGALAAMTFAQPT